MADFLLSQALSELGENYAGCTLCVLIELSEFTEGRKVGLVDKYHAI